MAFDDYVRIDNENERKEEYPLAEIFAILGWLTERFGIGWFPLANDVVKLRRNTEIDGLGVAIMRQQPGDVKHAQGSSYLGVVLEQIGILEWNKRHNGIKWRIIFQAQTLDDLRSAFDFKTDH